MTATVRLAAGFGLLCAGLYMAAVMAPPEPGGWSLAAIACQCLGAGIAGHAALDLMEEQ